MLNMPLGRPGCLDSPSRPGRLAATSDSVPGGAYLSAAGAHLPEAASENRASVLLMALEEKTDALRAAVQHAADVYVEAYGLDQTVAMAKTMYDIQLMTGGDATSPGEVDFLELLIDNLRDSTLPAIDIETEDEPDALKALVAELEAAQAEALAWGKLSEGEADAAAIRELRTLISQLGAARYRVADIKANVENESKKKVLYMLASDIRGFEEEAILLRSVFRQRPESGQNKGSASRR